MGGPWYWIDAQLPPALAAWIGAAGGRATDVDELGMLRAPDPEIFTAARAANAVVVTKDEDFVLLCGVAGATAPSRVDHGRQRSQRRAPRAVDAELAHGGGAGRCG